MKIGHYNYQMNGVTGVKRKRSPKTMNATQQAKNATQSTQYSNNTNTKWLNFKDHTNAKNIIKKNFDTFFGNNDIFDTFQIKGSYDESSQVLPMLPVFNIINYENVKKRFTIPVLDNNTNTLYLSFFDSFYKTHKPFTMTEYFIKNKLKIHHNDYGQFLVYCIIKANELFNKILKKQDFATSIHKMNKIRKLLFENEENAISGRFQLVLSNKYFVDKNNPTIIRHESRQSQQSQEYESFQSFLESLLGDYVMNFVSPYKISNASMKKIYEISNTHVWEYIDILIDTIATSNDYDNEMQHYLTKYCCLSSSPSSPSTQSTGGKMKSDFKKYTTKMINNKSRNIYVLRNIETKKTQKQYVKYNHQFYTIAEFKKILNINK